MNKAKKRKKKMDKRCYDFYYNLFNDYPTPDLAYPVFIYARKCDKEIPVEVLDAIAPVIEKLHNKSIKKTVQNSQKLTSKKKPKHILLGYALESDSIEDACQRYYRNYPNDRIEIPSYRKRLERFLREEIEHFLNTAPADIWKYYDKPKPGEQTTEEMLSTYKEIIVITNTCL